MKMESLKDKTDSLTRILLAVAGLLVALVFLKVGFFVSSSNAMMAAAQADPNKAEAEDMKKVLAQTKAAADEIKKKNLFVPAAARQNPVREVIGILGREALIGDKWYKVGESVGDAKIVAIEPTKVKVVWDGREQEFSPIGSSGAGGRGGPPSGLPGRGSGPGASGRGGMAAGARRGSGMQAGGAPSPEMDALRARWMNASPEEKQRLREEMRQKGGARGR
jgi:hypothetical protein